MCATLGGDGETNKVRVCVPCSMRQELITRSHAGSFSQHFAPRAIII